MSHTIDQLTCPELYHAPPECQGRKRRSMPVRSRILLDISSIETSVASSIGMPCRSNSDSAALISKATCGAEGNGIRMRVRHTMCPTHGMDGLRLEFGRERC